MKKIFMLLVACVAIMFVSCSKDDNGDNSGTTNKNGKKLVSKIIYDNIEGYDSEDYEINFSYDSKGNVSGTTEIWTYNGNSSKGTTTIKREGNKITMTEIDLKDEDIDYTWYTLDDAERAIKVEWGDESSTFTYDNEGQLKTRHDNSDDYYSSTFSYIWKQGNIVSKKETEVSKSGDERITTTNYEYYTQYENNISIDFTWETYGAYYMESYFGKTNKNLIKSVSYYPNSDYSSVDEYEYEFDGDYVSTVKEFNTYKGGERKLTGTYHIYYK